jgi:hypothetical protein
MNIVEYQIALQNNSNICQYITFVNNKMVYYATSCKFTGFISNEVTRFFN